MTLLICCLSCNNLSVPNNAFYFPLNKYQCLHYISACTNLVIIMCFIHTKTARGIIKIKVNYSFSGELTQKNFIYKFVIIKIVKSKEEYKCT